MQTASRGGFSHFASKPSGDSATDVCSKTCRRQKVARCSFTGVTSVRVDAVAPAPSGEVDGRLIASRTNDEPKAGTP